MSDDELRAFVAEIGPDFCDNKLYKPAALFGLFKEVRDKERERCAEVVLAADVVTEAVRVGGFPEPYECQEDTGATLEAAAHRIREGKQ